jgi:hypothetical protein
MNEQDMLQTVQRICPKFAAAGQTVMLRPADCVYFN